MKTARFLSAQIWSIAQAESGNAVYIRPSGSDMVLPVYVSESDIQTILVELTHILAPRPMVHELLLSTITSMHGRLDRVEIYGIRSGTYLCRIVLIQNGKEIKLESRPSDILCLSARVECPVQIDDEIIARNGVPIERIAGQTESAKKTDEAPPVIDLLQKELNVAIDREDYERAAVIRDQLADLSRARTDRH
jgi:bifunctional DNase/RNase